MSCQSIICEAVAFADQVEIRLACLEKHLDLPTFSIDPDDLFLGQFRVCTDKGDPVFPVLFVADTDDLRRKLLLANLDIYRTQVLAAATAFLTDTEDLLNGSGRRVTVLLM